MVSSTPMKTVAPIFLPLDILPNATVLVGENINLYCAVTGWPIPTVQWLNSECHTLKILGISVCRTTIPLVLPPQLLTAQFYFIFSFLDDSIVISNSSVLQLRNASLHDAGNYTCIAYNSGGRLVQKYTLDVQQKPYFNVTPTSKTYPPARTVRLDCQAKGVPKPKITWLKNGEPLPNAARIKRHPTGLVISHTFTSDSGMMRSFLCCFRLGGSFFAGIYQCIAVNAAGRVWAAAQLVPTFFDTPPSPPENVQCRSFDETSICLTWQSPQNVNITAYSIYCYYRGNRCDNRKTSNTSTKVNSPQSKLRKLPGFEKQFLNQISDTYRWCVNLKRLICCLLCNLIIKCLSMRETILDCHRICWISFTVV
jgi:hypothetical protein